MTTTKYLVKMEKATIDMIREANMIYRNENLDDDDKLAGILGAISALDLKMTFYRKKFNEESDVNSVIIKSTKEFKKGE